MKIEVDINKIFAIVCEYYGFHQVPIKGKSRRDDIVKVRQMYCYLANEYSKETYQKIGNVINREHATVIFSINKIRMQKEVYRSITNEINELTEKILLPKCVVSDIDLLLIAEYNTKINSYFA